MNNKLPAASASYQFIVPDVAVADNIREPVPHLAFGVTDDIPVTVIVVGVGEVTVPAQPLPLETCTL